MLSTVIDREKNEILGVDPRDGSSLPPVAITPIDSLSEKIEEARQAQRLWKRLSLKNRVLILTRVRNRFLEQADSLVKILCSENGKPESEAYTSEIVPNIGLFDYWLSQGPKLLSPCSVKLSPLEYPKKTGQIFLIPRGIIGLISPWNYPLSIPLRTLLPALIAGNAVLLKPSEYAPRIGQAIAELFVDIVPDGLLGLVQGDGTEGASLVDRVDQVCFTGSVSTGKRILEQAAQRLIPVSLELGGKDAAIVLEDADLERTAQGIAWAAFSNAGQNCASIERVYVHRSLFAALSERLVEIAQNLRLDQDLGPLTHQAQREIVEKQLEKARAMGAQILYGGERPPRDGFYLQPTVVVLPEAKNTPLEIDETFGPVVSIRIVDNENEAIACANDSRYGLSASIWSTDLERAKRLATQIDVGTVTINNHAFTAALPSAPWSGQKESGFGTTNSPRALRELCQTKFVLVDSSNEFRELWWYPYNETLLDLGKALVLRAQGGISTLRGMGRALRLLPRRFRKS